jgi:hypothetical protein
MGVKKIIKNAFEQVYESGRDIAKSSAKQIGETLSPWEMIRNSFNDSGKSPESNSNQMKSLQKELKGNGGKGTPLNFEKLDKSYANQDQMKIESMKQRLFQMVKNEDAKIIQRKDQKVAEKKQIEAHEIAEQRRREEEQKRVNALSAAPEGKSGRGTALMGKKKRKPTEPQPAETKPGGGKQ